MDCPKCSKGKIRVVAPVACSCGHHPLVCDECCQQFVVPCGPPYGEEALPPDAAMTEDESHRESYAAMIKTMGDKDAPPYEKMVKDTIASMPAEFPTVEEFKASLTA